MEAAPRKRKSRIGREALIIRGGALLLVIGLALATWSAGRSPAKPEVVEPIVIRVEDMECHVWCPIQIDDALAKVPGVFDLFVDVERGVVTAQVDPTKTSRDALAQKLESRGWVVLDGAEEARSPE